MSSVASPDSDECTWPSVLYHWSAPAAAGTPSAIAQATAHVRMSRRFDRAIDGGMASPGRSGAYGQTYPSLPDLTRVAPAFFRVATGVGTDEKRTRLAWAARAVPAHAPPL